jgi:hypothetical protein
VLLAALVAAPAGSAVNSTVTVSIGFNPGVGDPFFKGRVKSKNKTCMRNRRVVVYRSRNGGKTTRFKSARSDARGFWRVPMNARMKTAGYFAKVNGRGTCLADKSQQVGVGQKGPGGSGRRS